MLATWIAIGAVALIIGGAVFKIVRDKKKGIACTGCPDAKVCARRRAYGGCAPGPGKEDSLH